MCSSKLVVLEGIYASKTNSNFIQRKVPDSGSNVLKQMRSRRVGPRMGAGSWCSEVEDKGRNLFPKEEIRQILPCPQVIFVKIYYILFGVIWVFVIAIVKSLPLPFPFGFSVSAFDQSFCDAFHQVFSISFLSQSLWLKLPMLSFHSKILIFLGLWEAVDRKVILATCMVRKCFLNKL